MTGALSFEETNGNEASLCHSTSLELGSNAKSTRNRLVTITTWVTEMTITLVSK